MVDETTKLGITQPASSDSAVVTTEGIDNHADSSMEEEDAPAEAAGMQEARTDNTKPTHSLNLKAASKLIISGNQFFKVEKRTLNFSNGDKFSGDFDLTHARCVGL
jgi:hypothetical protein